MWGDQNLPKVERKWKKCCCKVVPMNNLYVFKILASSCHQGWHGLFSHQSCKSPAHCGNIVVSLDKIPHFINNWLKSEILLNSQFMRLWYLSHRRPAICAVSSEPLLFTHMKYESGWRVWPKIRSLAPLDGWRMSLQRTKDAMIRVFAGCTCHFVGFVVSRLNCICDDLYESQHNKTNKTTCAASKDFDQPGHLPSLISLCYPWRAQQRLISLGRCPGWSESSLGAHVILFVLSCSGSFNTSSGTDSRLIKATSWLELKVKNPVVGRRSTPSPGCTDHVTCTVPNCPCFLSTATVAFSGAPSLPSSEICGVLSYLIMAGQYTTGFNWCFYIL